MEKYGDKDEDVPKLLALFDAWESFAFAVRQDKALTREVIEDGLKKVASRHPIFVALEANRGLKMTDPNARPEPASNPDWRRSNSA